MEHRVVAPRMLTPCCAAHSSKVVVSRASPGLRLVQSPVLRYALTASAAPCTAKYPSVTCTSSGQAWNTPSHTTVPTASHHLRLDSRDGKASLISAGRRSLTRPPNSQRRSTRR